MDVLATMKTVLVNATSSVNAKVYEGQNPDGATPPYVVYNFVGNDVLDRSNSASIGSLHQKRCLLTMVGSTRSARKALVDLVFNALENNTTDFEVCLSTPLEINRKEFEDIFSTVKEFFVDFRYS